jgi:hypothetical protein
MSSLPDPIEAGRPTGSPVRGATSPAVTLALWLIVALLGLSAFLLWRLLEQDPQPVAATTPATKQPLGAPPPLPEPKRTSANALLDELDATTTRLTGPLEEMQVRLQEAVRQLAFTQTLPGLLSGIAANTDGFGGVPEQLQQLTAQARRLAKVRAELVQILSQLQTFRGTAGQLRLMVKNVRGIRTDFRGAVRSLSSIEGTVNGTFPKVVDSLEGMRADVARIRECAEKAFVCSNNSQPPGVPLPRTGGEAPAKKEIP